MSSQMKGFWYSVSFIVMSKFLLGCYYVFSNTDKGDFYTGKAGVYMVLVTILDLFFVCLAVGFYKYEKNKSNKLNHAVLAILLIVLSHYLSNIALDYSFQKNLV